MFALILGISYKAISLLSRRQSSHSENADGLSDGKNYCGVSVQVSKSADVH